MKTLRMDPVHIIDGDNDQILHNLIFAVVIQDNGGYTLTTKHVLVPSMEGRECMPTITAVETSDGLKYKVGDKYDYLNGLVISDIKAVDTISVILNLKKQ